MARHLLASSFPNCTRTKLPSVTLLPRLPKPRSFVSPVRCVVGPEIASQNTVRRTANYHPPIWNDDFLQSLSNEYVGELYANRINKLKEEVRMMLNHADNRLELIDTLQRLGLAYHLQDEIKRILSSIYNHNLNEYTQMKKEDLCATALEFRLLRQHGYKVSQEIFKSFQDEVGNFKTCLCEDLEGMLSLYEASYLSEEGESILQVARDFTTTFLEKFIEQNKDQTHLSILISHALELPLHWRMLRLETRWFIDLYEKKQGMSPLLLELAKLDFNHVQATHQDDLKYVSRWWKNTGLGENLSFARDRIMENFLWNVGVIFEPQFQHYRTTSTKIYALITTIDDIYDVYGTMDELELFTDAVERWDVNAMEQLPDYMKICFLVLHNSINEIAFDTLKEEGYHIIPYLKKAWADLCKAYLLEAKWYHSGYTPTLQEYIDNAWISVGAPVILIHSYFLVKSPITNDGLKCLEEYPNIIQWSSMILRLADDLGTSSDELKRGDVSKSIQCYMHETGASEEEAREHIRYLISETWMKMNKEQIVHSPFSQNFIGVAVNLARMAQCMYQHGDGHGIENRETKDRVMSLLVQPIPCMPNFPAFP